MGLANLPPLVPFHEIFPLNDVPNIQNEEIVSPSIDDRKAKDLPATLMMVLEAIGEMKTENKLFRYFWQRFVVVFY